MNLPLSGALLRQDAALAANRALRIHEGDETGRKFPAVFFPVFHVWLRHLANFSKLSIKVRGHGARSTYV